MIDTWENEGGTVAPEGWREAAAMLFSPDLFRIIEQVAKLTHRQTTCAACGTVMMADPRDMEPLCRACFADWRDSPEAAIDHPLEQDAAWNTWVARRRMEVAS